MDTSTPGTREHEVLSAAARQRRMDLARLHEALRDQDSTTADDPAVDELFAVTHDVLAREGRAAQATAAWHQARQRDRETYLARIAAHRYSRMAVGWCGALLGLAGVGLAVAGWWAGFLTWWQCCVSLGAAVVAVSLWLVEAEADPAAHRWRRSCAFWCAGLGVVLSIAMWSGRDAWWADVVLLAVMLVIAASAIRGRISADSGTDEAIFSHGLILIDFPEECTQ